MKFIFLLVFLSAAQVDVPYKPNSDFKLDVDYQLRQRPQDHSTLDWGERDNKRSQALTLPYLIVNCRLLKLADGEAKVRVITSDGHTVFTKKAEVGVPLMLDMGFTEDMKDRVTPHEYNIYLLSSKKLELSRIQLVVMENGDFLINGERRGKF